MHSREAHKPNDGNSVKEKNRSMVPTECQLKLLPVFMLTLLPLNLFSYFLNAAFALKNIVEGRHKATVNHATVQYCTHTTVI
jgi:hypothetical protein